MRVLHLISTAGFYGAESMLLSLSTALRDAGHGSIIGVIGDDRAASSELAQRAWASGLDSREIACRGRFDLDVPERIVSLLNREGVQVVHTHGYKSDIYGLAGARKAGVPVTATCHNWTSGTRALRAYAKLDRFVLRRFPLIAAVSDQVEDLLRSAGIAAERIRVIPNGIDLDRFASENPLLQSRPYAGSWPVIGMVGRLVREKGFQDVLTAAATLRACLPRAAFVIFGEGPYRDELQSQADRLNLPKMVHFAGYREDMAAAYASLDAFVLPSYNEGTPMTILEAMAAGKPVIATRVGGVPAIINDGVTGLLVNPGAADEIAGAIRLLFSRPELAPQIGRAARERIQDYYSAREMARKYLETYNSLRSAGGRRTNAISVGAP